MVTLDIGERIALPPGLTHRGMNRNRSSRLAIGLRDDAISNGGLATFNLDAP